MKNLSSVRIRKDDSQVLKHQSSHPFRHTKNESLNLLG